VTRRCGNSNPELRTALCTRSRDSRTLASGSPTIVIAGNPPSETSTSTSIGYASMPNVAAVRSVASTPQRIARCCPQRGTARYAAPGTPPVGSRHIGRAWRSQTLLRDERLSRKFGLNEHAVLLGEIPSGRRNDRTLVDGNSAVVPQRLPHVVLTYELYDRVRRRWNCGLMAACSCRQRVLGMRRGLNRLSDGRSDGGSTRAGRLARHAGNAARGKKRFDPTGE
jgi:hypothetical protein